MPKTSTGSPCPLCQGDLTEDRTGRGFTRHKERPVVSKVLASPLGRRLKPLDVAYLRKTGLCPYERGLRD